MGRHGKVELYFGGTPLKKKIRMITATVLLLALAAFLFSACGGSDTQSPPPAPVSTSKSTAAKSSPTDKPESLIGSVIVPTDQSPKNFQNSLKNRRPVVVFFYMTGISDDNDVRTSINQLKSKYQGQIDFEDYSFSDASSYGDLTALLKINSTPSVVMINKQAKVEHAWTGYVDDKSLEQGIQDAKNH